MPKISRLVFGLPADITVTIDKTGGHLWAGAKADEPDDAVHVTYDTGYLTGEYIDSIAAAETAGKHGAIISFMKIIQKWDVTDKAGKPIPLTEDDLNNCPLPVLNAIIAGCLEDMRGPDPKP